jgi:membrane associated rhomboid family serine protease
VFGVYSLLGGFGSNSVDIYAHVGGLVAGFACGVAIEAKRDADAPRLARTIFVALFGLCAVISAVVLAPEPAPR